MRGFAAAVGFAGAVAACDANDTSATPQQTYYEAGLPDSEGEQVDLVTVRCPVKPPDPNRVRVMVVDHGFDVRHPIFSGKIAGCYQLSCADDASDFVPLPGEPDDDAAARLVKMLSTPGPECEVKEGMSLRIDAHLEHFDPAARDQWNAAMLSKQRLDASWPYDVGTLLDELEGIVSNVPIDPLGFEPLPSPSFIYHGTSTAGAVAYANDVDIVLVDRPLGVSGVVGEPATCLDPVSVDQEVRLLSRADVQDAYVHAPISGVDKALTDLRRQHGIEIENHSYGRSPVADVNQNLLLNRCPAVSLGDQTKLTGALAGERDAFLRSSGALDGADPLIFQSGGNEAYGLNSAADSLECTPDRVDRLLVGSYDVFRGQAARSEFSNFGDCIDLYALGETVILPGPSGFYSPVTGTSFSAPLAARYASRLWKPGMAMAALRDAVLTARDENRFLPVSTMPIELAFNSAAVGPAHTLGPQVVRAPSLVVARSSGPLGLRVGGP